ncbi:MAG TPA: glutathione S-transferase [Ramlibacter sp.]
MSNEYVLYGAKGSGSAAVEAALTVGNLPHRIVEAATWLPESALPALRAVNPLQQIPTLVMPDGSVLTESAAILVQLGLHLPAGVLLPADPAHRAQMLRGLVYIPANCYSAIGIIDYPERWTDQQDQASLEAVKAGTRKRLHRHWEIFADQFPQRPFLSGEAPGALDILAAVVSRWAGTRKHLQEHRPAFHDLLQQVDSHPSLAPVFRRHWDA